MHADFSHHDFLGLERRLNLLLYFNEEWRPEYGGHLGLYNKRLELCKSISLMRTGSRSLQHRKIAFMDSQKE